MDSAFAKLSRAKVHLDNLKSDEASFQAREPHELTSRVTEHLFDPSLKVITYRVHVKEATPTSWGLIVGDILTNPPAALDHAVYGHAAGRTTLTSRQQGAIKYPIALDRESQYWSKERKTLEPIVDPAVLSVIERYQPFNHE